MKQEHIELFLELLIKEREANSHDGAKKVSFSTRFGEKTTSEMGDTINEYERCMAESEKRYEDYQKIKAELLAVQDELRQLKKERIYSSASYNMYKIMIDFARAKGFKFERAEAMKQFLANAGELNNKEQGDVTQGVIFDNDKTPCPSRLHDTSGNSVMVASKYCRKKCPWFESIDEDQGVVVCKMN